MGDTNTSADDDFELGGYARTNYVSSTIWKDRMAELEELSARFGAVAWKDNVRAYKWPHDPLHWWSRTWEYPWIANQLEALSLTKSGRKVLDVGAAVTFFSAYLVNCGFEVTNLDYDVDMPHIGSVAFKNALALGVACRQPRYVVGDATAMKFPQGEFDVVQSISVLEHIPRWDRALSEMTRVLKPGGHLILTFDVKRNSHSNGLSDEETSRLIAQIKEDFEEISRVEGAVPRDALTTSTAPISTTIHPLDSIPVRKGMGRLLPISTLPTRLAARLRRTLPRSPEEIAIYGGVWRKRDGTRI